MPTAPAASRANKKAHEQVTTGLASNAGFPRANGFNGFLRALPGDRALLSPSPRNAKHCRELTSASRGQDHTTSPSTKSAVRRSTPSRPSQPAPTFVTIAKRPSSKGAGRPRLVEVICPTAQVKSFGAGAAPMRPIGTTGKSVEALEKCQALSSFRGASVTSEPGIHGNHINAGRNRFRVQPCGLPGMTKFSLAPHSAEEHS